MSALADLRDDIQAGAWVTPSGDPIVAVHDTDEGNCGYCGDVIYGVVAETASGTTQAVPGHPMVWVLSRRRLEPWHVECLRWRFHWTVNNNGTVHLVDCRHAEPGRRSFEGTRGEARHELGDRFCNHCAPIGRWCAPDRLEQEQQMEGPYSARFPSAQSGETSRRAPAVPARASSSEIGGTDV